MSRILLTSGTEDWRKLLADPEKHWKSGYSACTLAHCWEASEGVPPEIAKALAKTNDPLLANLTALLAVPEFKVPLPGGSRASQNDVFVVARSSAGPVCLMVEGKVNESREAQSQIEKEIPRTSSPQKDRKRQALQVVRYKLATLDFHIVKSKDLLGDLRKLRRMIFEEGDIQVSSVSA